MRIVSLLSSATEMLFELKLGAQVLAVSHECDFPEEVQALPRATRSRIDSSQPSGAIDRQVKSLLEAGEPLYEVDRDLLCTLRPDLIVTQAQCDVCAVRYQDVIDLVAAEPALSQARVLALNPQSLSEILADIGRVGEAAGAERAAAEVIESLHSRIDRVRACAGQSGTVRPRVVCLEWLDPLMAAGNWTPELIELAGGESGLAAPFQHSGYVTWDEVRAYDPDVLIIAPCGFDLGRSLVEAAPLPNLPGYRDVSAVRSGRVFVIDGNAYLNRSGPRIVETLEILAHLIQPSSCPWDERLTPSERRFRRFQPGFAGSSERGLSSVDASGNCGSN